MTSACPATFDVKAWLAGTSSGRIAAQHRKGTPIFAQGDPADSVYYIQRGKVKLSVVSEAGREAVIGILDRGDFLGEECLAGTPAHLAAASALSQCWILKIEKRVFNRLLREEPAFSEMFVAYLLSRTIRMEADLVDQLFNSCEKRLARMLLMLANFGKEPDADTEIAKISQETLANMIGTTRSRVSFFMNNFRKRGMIEYSAAGDGKIEVHSSLLNILLHQ